MEVSENFWQSHKESREKLDEDMANLPYSKKLEILEKMKVDHEAMMNAKVESEEVLDK